VENLLHRAAEKKRGPSAASPGSHEEKVVASVGLAAKARSGIPADDPPRLVPPATSQLLQPRFVMPRDRFGEAARGKTKEVSALLDDGGANIRDRSDVKKRQASARLVDEIFRGANGRERLLRKIDSDEDTKPTHFGADSMLRARTSVDAQRHDVG
jgi:hypothetical protein